MEKKKNQNFFTYHSGTIHIPLLVPPVVRVPPFEKHFYESSLQDQVVKLFEEITVCC